MSPQPESRSAINPATTPKGAQCHWSALKLQTHGETVVQFFLIGENDHSLKKKK